MASIQVMHGDCLALLPTLAEASVDAVVTDPPYHLGEPRGLAIKTTRPTGFMGQRWDGGDIAFQPEVWAQVLRVLKPGGHLVAFGGSRTYHRLACAVEDAGFEIRDQIMWIYGSGFPKSLDVSKAIDKAAGAEREIVGPNPTYRKDQINAPSFTLQRNPDLTAPATDAARKWQGFGTAMKPASEIIVLARKPLGNGTEIDLIGSSLRQLWSRLWLMLPANVAERCFPLSPLVSIEDMCASARWSVERACSSRDALFAQTDMPPLELVLISSLNTVSSWNAIWDACSEQMSTSTIETELKTTIELKTLRFLTSQITPDSIIQAHKTGHWSTANASSAERVFNVAARRLEGTLELSALAPAIAQAADGYLDAGAKPLNTPIVLARKPLIGTVAENVLKHGVGALNIDACRVEGEPTGERRNNVSLGSASGGIYGTAGAFVSSGHEAGRWPANLIHDGSDEVVGAFPETASGMSVGRNRDGNERPGGYEGGWRKDTRDVGFNDSGSAARFFYTAKADTDDRLGSKHPTVKPVDLMAYLCRLVCPAGGLVLDPFAGSGSTGMACMREGFRAILIEREAEYVADIRRRIDHVSGEDTPLFTRTAACQPS